tara:strand:- start:242 stop:559 length:318 start_codon:yes stop_codon:yes gene_type:complete
MNPGLLDRVVEIWVYTVTRDSMGGEVEDWSKLKDCRARRIDNKGKENVEATKETGVSYVTWRIRFSSSIDQTAILKYDGYDYEIKSINEWGGRKAYLDLFTEKKI